MPMDDATPSLPSHASIPLIYSRLDHLEFIMKYLERRQRGGSNACGEKQCMPLDLAVKETYVKGSLLDRVASLENRLLQLCLEMESSSGSNPLSRASAQTSGESSSSQSTNKQFYSSFPTFNSLSNPQSKPVSHNHIHTLHQLQEKPGREEQQVKKESPPKQQEVKNGGKRNQKKSKSPKKQTPSNWPHFRLLGC